MEYKYISSKNNELISKLASLKNKKYRNEYNMYICEGRKICIEAISKCNILYALINENKLNSELEEIAINSKAEIILVSESVYQKISSDQSFDGIIFIIQVSYNTSSITNTDRIMFFDNIQDPGNMGTIIRSAVAFGFNKLILHNCVDIYNPKVIKSTMGAIFNIDIIDTECISVLNKLKEQNRRILSTALNETSKSLGEIDLCTTDVVVIGNEGHGVSNEIISLSDINMIIPISEKSESLNASIAASVVMWEYSKISSCS